MIHRLLIAAIGACFLADAVVFLTYGVGMGDWRAVAVGVVEAVGAMAFVVLGVN